MAGTLPFRRVAIIGTGLIGGSFALALRRYFPDISIIGYDRPNVLQSAVARGAIKEAASDLLSTLRGADLVYLALPIVPTLEVLPEIAKRIDPGALVTDACSTKSVICRAAREDFRGGAIFLGGHPMAGKEQSGIEHADAELFHGAPYALIGSAETAYPRAKMFAETLAAIGAQPRWCDADTHDWAVGIVSHLPQMVSIALARVVQDETDETGLPLSLAGQGLQDMLRLAGSPYGVWRDILLTNTENVSRALDRLAQTIDYLRTRLATKELEGEFQAANEIYKQLQKQR
ncbi:MAG TPA: prephenate dehydrogenase/arogenate dehydrogenase family protein [Candidatus Dormibacteraeota bacterium]|nr:prephenate dehydrogenase/arogenate dehydrogenase family protein [Candidatus Dormibacteraeota bacterium]